MKKWKRNNLLYLFNCPGKARSVTTLSVNNKITYIWTTHWYRLIQLRSVSTSWDESKHHYLTEIISLIGERVPSETYKTYAFSRYHGTEQYHTEQYHLNSLRVFLYNLKRFNALTRDSFRCGYDNVVPLIETIKMWNDLSCTKLGVILERMRMIY